MALAAKRAGYDVHVATRVNEGGAAIRGYGFTLHPLAWRRGSFNPVDLFQIIRDVRRLYRTLAPDLVHHVALQPTLIGSLAAAGLPVRRINALAGLGYGFTSGTLKARGLRLVLAPAMRLLLNHPNSAVLLQNPDDRAAVEALGISSDRIFVVPGSGVDIDVLKPLPEPDGPITAAFVGRLLYDKGIGTLMEAFDLLARRGETIRLLDRRRARSRQPGLGDGGAARAVAAAAECRIPRSRRRHPLGVEQGPPRRAAVAARGLAQEPARGRRLRTGDHRQRRSRLPRDRAPRCQRAAGAAGRSRQLWPTRSSGWRRMRSCAGALPRRAGAGRARILQRTRRRGNRRPLRSVALNARHCPTIRLLAKQAPAASRTRH